MACARCLQLLAVLTVLGALDGGAEERLKITASLDGCFVNGSPWHVVIDPDGKGHLTVYTPGEETTGRFEITMEQMQGLAALVEEERFFDLQPVYGERVFDSSTRTLTIERGEQSHTVEIRFLMNWVHSAPERLIEPVRAVRVWNAVAELFVPAEAAGLEPMDEEFSERSARITRMLYDAVAPLELGLKPVPPEKRLVGIAYTNWHPEGPWKNVWGEPELGHYSSLHRAVIRQHAEWLYAAGVDFVWIDWSNNVNYVPGSKPKSAWERIEQSTAILFEEFVKRERRPMISIFLGVTGAPEAVEDGRLQRKADQVYDMYVANPKYRPLVQDYLGKPLLAVYTDTPTPWQDGTPVWGDGRFTVRWMTGFVTEQPNLRTDKLVSKYGYWSWEDRGPQTVTIRDGHAESMVVVASWRKQGEPGTNRYVPPGLRRNGQTFREQWARARAFGPNVVTVVSWNEWVLGEQPSPENSKDIEPSKEFGHHYLNLLGEEITRFKKGEKGAS